MTNDAKLFPNPADEGSPESPEERARRVAEIKRRIARGNYRVDSREIIYNMLKTAP